MVQWVYKAACKSGADRVVIATDDESIETVARGFGAEVCMTSAAHQSGTDRLAEVTHKLGLSDSSLVVNLQGDEPLMPPSLLSRVAQDLANHPDAAMGTAMEPITHRDDLQNPNVVKVVGDLNQHALYFSRAVIPWPRQESMLGEGAGLAAGTWHRHIGLYAYRVGFVQQFVNWGPCELEKTEMLEQLRALWHGIKIRLVSVEESVPGGVDSPEDLARVRAVLARN